MGKIIIFVALQQMLPKCPLCTGLVPGIRDYKAKQSNLCHKEIVVLWKDKCL